MWQNVKTWKEHTEEHFKEFKSGTVDLDAKKIDNNVLQQQKYKKNNDDDYYKNLRDV